MGAGGFINTESKTEVKDQKQTQTGDNPIATQFGNVTGAGSLFVGAGGQYQAEGSTQIRQNGDNNQLGGNRVNTTGDHNQINITSTDPAVLDTIRRMNADNASSLTSVIQSSQAASKDSQVVSAGIIDTVIGQIKSLADNKLTDGLKNPVLWLGLAAFAAVAYILSKKR